MLKRVWQRAICKAKLRVLGGELSAANIPVIVVPMLDPKIRGKTRSIETRPMPTNGVRVDVKTELLWMITVRAAPILGKNFAN